MSLVPVFSLSKLLCSVKLIIPIPLCCTFFIIYFSSSLYLQTGPPQYQSSTVFEDATPEIVRDFFWDDEFRTKNGWDNMLLHHEILDECAATGTMVARWVRKV